MLKIGFFIVMLTLLSPFGAPRAEDKLDRVWRFYSKWASEHLEYECTVSPEMENVHTRFRLWQIKQGRGEAESILKANFAFPISHETYIFWNEDGRRMIYFPEINRTIFSCLDQEPDSELGPSSFGISTFWGSLKQIKKFLVFEDLIETDESIIFEVILDAERMRDSGLLPERPGVGEARFIFAFKKSGELVRLSRQFDNGDLEVLRFDYVTFSSDEVRESFPKIKNLCRRNIVPGFTYAAALEEIKQLRRHSEILGDK